MENVNNDNRDGNQDYDSSDSELESLGLEANVPLDIPPRDIPVRHIRALSDPLHSALKHRPSFPEEERLPGPSSMKRSSEVNETVKSRVVSSNIGKGKPKDMDKLILIVDGTRFVVERSLFIAHPNTMLGR